MIKNGWSKIWPWLVALLVVGFVLGIGCFSGLSNRNIDKTIARLKATVYVQETSDYLPISAYSLGNAGVNYDSGSQYSIDQVRTTLAILDNAELFGRHSLMPLVEKSIQALNGDFTSGFLQGTSGTIHATTSERLVFSWRTPTGKVFISSLAFSQIVFQIVASGETPNVQFKFQGDELIAAYAQNKATALNNLNVFITDASVAYAIIRISQEDEESNLYLLFK